MFCFERHGAWALSAEEGVGVRRRGCSLGVLERRWRGSAENGEALSRACGHSSF